MLLEDMANEIVSFTSELVGGRTINVMNTDGIIVASTEKHRIGSFHQGALEAVRTGRPVAIRADQLAQYPGAKQGYNMPLRVNGAVIGVVGIFGDPPEVENLAKLVEAYVTKSYQLEAMMIPRLAEGEMRSRLIHDLLIGDERSLSHAQVLLESLRLELQPPFGVGLFSAAEGAESPDFPEKAMRLLQDRGCLSDDHGVVGMERDKVVLIESMDVLRELGRQAEQSGGQLRFSLGRGCENIGELRRSYEEAMALELVSLKAFSTMEDTEDRCACQLYRAAAAESVFLDSLEARLYETFRADEVRSLLQTVQTYYACGRSASRAAEQLFLHKNTLQYRVKRVLKCLGLLECGEFQQEYVMRLLFIHGKRKQGLQTLK